MKITYRKNAIEKLLHLFIQNSGVGTGEGLTGLTYATAGLTAYYYREGATAPVVIPLVATTPGVWAAGGFVEVDSTHLPGVYQLGLPNAALAEGADTLVLMLQGAADMAPSVAEIQLADYDYAEVVPSQTAPVADTAIAEDTDSILSEWGETVGVYRNEITYGGDGAASLETWNLIVSCLADIQPYSGNMRTRAVGQERQSTHRIFFPANTPVIPGDKIRKYGWVAGDDEYLVDHIFDEEGHVEVEATIVRGRP